VKYKAFISYSHADRKLAKRFHHALERVPIPKHLRSQHESALVYPVFLDRAELAASSSLNDEIESALRQSEWLVVLCSPAAARSKYVRQEIVTFSRMHSRNRVLPVILSGDPYSKDPSTECLPDVIRYEFSSDGTIEHTPSPAPLAADSRKDKDGFTNAVLKIAARVIGSTFDELKQRALQRLVRTIVTASTVGAIAMTILAASLFVAAVNGRLAQERLNQSAGFTRDASERVLDLQQELGLRTGAAKALIQDAENRLKLMLQEMSDAGTLQFFGLGSQDALVESMAHTLLNYAEIELQDLTFGAKSADRIQIVRRAMDHSHTSPEQSDTRALILSRTSFVEASATRNAEPPARRARELIASLTVHSARLEKVPVPQAKFVSAQIAALRGNLLYYVFDKQEPDTASQEAQSLLSSAETELSKALELYNAIVKSGDRRPRVQREVLGTMYALSDVRYSRSGAPAQLETLLSAESLFNAMPVTTQRAFGIRFEHARILTSLASALFELGKPETAIPKLQLAEAELKGLVDLDPDNMTLQCDLLAVKQYMLKILGTLTSREAASESQRIQSSDQGRDELSKRCQN
jgi:hypothetical protein